ncbi:aminotransferase class V-fold PLP-dependent enzyme [Streptomyces sp. UG1]|uniref:aminotransferase class V-fold PLP-dependent enzyme n=1 Tax=Streptomyces sp. UG1 TaxID=3417652 RepID=UPI003CF93DA7
MVGLPAAVIGLTSLDREAVAAYEDGLTAYAAPGPVRRAHLHPRRTPPGHRRRLAGPRRKIAVRAGHHCAQPAPSHYGLESAARASLAICNTAEGLTTEASGDAGGAAAVSRRRSRQVPGVDDAGPLGAVDGEHTPGRRIHRGASGPRGNRQYVGTSSTCSVLRLRCGGYAASPFRWG